MKKSFFFLLNQFKGKWIRKKGLTVSVITNYLTIVMCVNVLINTQMYSLKFENNIFILEFVLWNQMYHKHHAHMCVVKNQ